MTESEFNKKFHGVVGPAYRGAKYPKFDPAGINELNFSDDLRLKNYDDHFHTDDDGNIAEVVIDWESQLWDENGIDGLKDEIARCFKHIGYDGKTTLHVFDRDGEGDVEVCF